MDPRIEKLRAAGFSDADIAEYLKDTPPSTADAGGGAEQEPPSVSPVVPETQANNVVPGTGMMEGLATAAAGISPSADTLTKIGEGALAYKGLQSWRAASAANQARAAADAAAEAGRQARFNAKFPPVAGPAVPTQAPVQTAPVQTALTAPATAPQAPQMQAAKSIVQKLALDKILKGAGVAGAVYGLGQGLFGTSDEEIATLKAAEARKRALGQR